MKIKKFKKLLMDIFAVLFILVTGYGMVVFFLIWKHAHDKPELTSDTMVVLGAQVKGENIAAAYPSRTLKERLDAAFDYWNTHQSMTVIVSGGQGADEPDAEGNVMADYLINKGVPANLLIRETKSTSTKENLVYSNRLHALDNAIVVTSDFHVYRAKLIGKHLGFKLQGLASPTENASKYHSWLREALACGYTIIFH